MSDRWVLLVATATTVGAWWAPGAPGWTIAVGAAAVLTALLARRPSLLVAGVLVLAAGLAHRAWVATADVTSGPFDGIVTLRTDPERVGPLVRVEVVAGHRHLEAWAHGSGAAAISRRLAGEQLQLNGRTRPAPDAVRFRLAARHIVGRIDVEQVGDWWSGSPAARAANRVRRTLADGAQVLPLVDRSLFTGFVVGDDRDEPKAVVQEFRAAGLSHLTAVSGENVAFLLTLAGPGLRRLGLRTRWLATLTLIGWFALLTRFEPSVLRAATMAGLAATAVFLARPASTIRLLGLTVAALVLIDPLIVHSAGWWLSVGATAGIVVLAGPLARRLPGPRVLAELLAVTAAAQLGVAPVSLAVFGGIPVMSIPANLLAVPVAGPVMVWGLPAGLVAGLVPTPVARVLHLPSLVCLRWIALVAHVAARRPLTAGPVTVGVFAFVVAGVIVLRSPRSPGRRARSSG